MLPQHGGPSLCCVTWGRQAASLNLSLGTMHSGGLAGPAGGVLGLALQLRLLNHVLGPQARLLWLPERLLHSLHHSVLRDGRSPSRGQAI